MGSWLSRIHKLGILILFTRRLSYFARTPQLEGWLSRTENNYKQRVNSNSLAENPLIFDSCGHFNSRKKHKRQKY